MDDYVLRQLKDLYGLNSDIPHRALRFTFSHHAPYPILDPPIALEYTAS